MSQAEALLNNLSDIVVEHKHNVPDSDTHFIIDPNTRQIENTNYQKTVLMRGDHNSERFTFEVPRYIDGHDMSLCNRVIVHFDNVGTATENVHSDVAYMDDLKINPDEPSTVISSWLIRREATQIVGILSFSIQYLCVENGEVTYEWNTDSYSGIEIRESKNNGEGAVIEYTNVLEEWRSKVFGAGDSVMADINAESATQQEAIKRKGSETLATIPNSYTDVYNLAREAVQTKSDAIVLSSEGDTVTVNNAANDYIRGLNVYGKSTQVVTTGAQILPQPYYDATKVSNGVTFTVNDDGSITIAGTSTSTDTVSCYFTINSGLKLSGTYTYKCYGLPTSCVTNIYYIGDVEGESERTMQLVDGNDYGFIIRVKPNSNVNARVYPMLVKGNVSKPYEPYTAGTIAPNPTYPQNIASINNPRITISGDQLLNLSTKASPSVELKVTSDVCEIKNLTTNRYGNVTFRETLGPGVYTVAVDSFDGSIIDSGHLIKLTDDDENVYITSLTTANLSRNFTLTKDTTVKIEIYSGNTTIGDVYTIHGLRIYAGMDNRPWSSYIERQLIDLACTIHGIPVTEGGNYTDEDGQQWVCDEVDLERGVYIKRLHQEIYDGSTDERWNAATNYFYLIKESMPYPSKPSGAALSTHFRHDSSLSKASSFRLGGLYGPMFKFLTDVTTVDSLRNWLSANPVVFLYELASYIEIPLTDDEIAAYKALKTNYPNTTIFNDQGAHMIVKYNADTLIFLRDNQPKPTDEQVEAAVNAYADEHGIQVPSDNHIDSRIAAAISAAITGAIGGSY